MQSIRDDFEQAGRMIREFTARDENFVAIRKAGCLMVECLQKGKKIISCGNGGSMCDAMHFAEELSGRFRDERPSLAAVSISDPSFLTCAANDYGFEHVFSRFIEGLGNEGDVLLAISTSGRSANIINALSAARKKSMKIIALTGQDGGWAAQNSDVEIRAPFSRYSDRTQEIHIKVIHALIRFIENNYRE